MSGTDLSLKMPRATTVGSLTTPHTHSPAAVAAQKFEGLMISTLLKQGLAGGGIDGSTGLFGSGPGSDVYQGFLETYLSEHIAKSGGLGLAKSLEQSLSGKARS